MRSENSKMRKLRRVKVIEVTCSLEEKQVFVFHELLSASRFTPLAVTHLPLSILVGLRLQQVMRRSTHVPIRFRKFFFDRNGNSAGGNLLTQVYRYAVKT